MKKYLTLILLSCLFSIINSNGFTEEKDNINNKILKIGLLVPLSGEFEKVGKSVLNGINLALHDIKSEKIKIFPKDSGANSEDTYNSVKEFQEMGIKIVIGPIFHESLSRLEDFDKMFFFTLTNKIHWLPDNSLSVGVNIISQFKAINEYLKKNKSETILLMPEKSYINEAIKIINEKETEYKKNYSYKSDPESITAEIAKITSYNQRKINLIARKNKLKESDLKKDKKELEYLDQRYTLGNVNFKSVIIADFGERLKSVIASFIFSDVSSKDVTFFTLNQWFDESLLNESSAENLIFPSVNYKNYLKFAKKYFVTYAEAAEEISLLAYDTLGLINFIVDEKLNIDFKKLTSKKGFKGLQGNFIIKKKVIIHDLKLYQVSNKEFLEIN